jgi:hypothetical protein
MHLTERPRGKKNAEAPAVVPQTTRCANKHASATNAKVESAHRHMQATARHTHGHIHMHMHAHTHTHTHARAHVR